MPPLSIFQLTARGDAENMQIAGNEKYPVLVPESTTAEFGEMIHSMVRAFLPAIGAVLERDDVHEFLNSKNGVMTWYLLCASLFKSVAIPVDEAADMCTHAKVYRLRDGLSSITSDGDLVEQDDDVYHIFVGICYYSFARTSYDYVEGFHFETVDPVFQNSTTAWKDMYNGLVSSPLLDAYYLELVDVFQETSRMRRAKTIAKRKMQDFMLVCMPRPVGEVENRCEAYKMSVCSGAIDMFPVIYGMLLWETLREAKLQLLVCIRDGLAIGQANEISVALKAAF
jgi:hypothetical protein